MSILALLFATLALGQAEPAPDTSGWHTVVEHGEGAMLIDPRLIERNDTLRRFRTRFHEGSIDAFAIMEGEADCKARSIAMIHARMYEHGVLTREESFVPADTRMTAAQDADVAKALTYICAL